MSWLIALIAKLFHVIVEAWIRESKKPKETTMVGGDEYAKTNIDNDITNTLNGM